MKISGKCKIANKWEDGVLDKNAFDFENKGKVAKGRLTWFDTEKDREGVKKFVSTTKKFLCFGATIDFIEQNLGQSLEIEGSLKSNEFTNDTGKKVKYEEIIVNEVKLAEEKQFDGRNFVKAAQSAHNAAKSNGFQPQAEEEDLDEIPF